MKLKPYLCILLILALGCKPESKKVRWDGYISQEDRYALSNKYKSYLEWEQTGDQITYGEGYYEISSDSSLSLLCAFKGEIRNDTIHLDEYEIIRASKINGEWFTKKLTLFYTNEEQTQLKGRWYAYKSRTAGGEMFYNKTE